MPVQSRCCEGRAPTRSTESPPMTPCMMCRWGRRRGGGGRGCALAVCAGLPQHPPCHNKRALPLSSARLVRLWLQPASHRPQEPQAHRLPPAPGAPQQAPSHVHGFLARGQQVEQPLGAPGGIRLHPRAPCQGPLKLVPEGDRAWRSGWLPPQYRCAALSECCSRACTRHSSSV